MGRREGDEGALPVRFVDLPEPLAGPPPTDRGHHVVDPAESLLHLIGQLFGPGERRVLVDDQVQVLGRRLAEDPPELLRALLGASGDDDVGAGAQVRPDDALAHGAGAARNENPATGQVR
jgi:hypothetical protein